MITERTKLGLAAEETVARHLADHGYRILSRNWRRPLGELDIVASKGPVVHFVEVKASSQLVTGFAPFLRANDSKMHKVRRTAQAWLAYHHYGPETEWQMDVASVIMAPGKTPEIELFEQV